MAAFEDNRRAPRRRPSDAGFTMIELLVVMIVIGILAAIAIPTYSGMRQRAQKARVTADITNLAKSVRAAQVAGGFETWTSITGTNWSAGPCYPVGKDIAHLPRTDACWVAYLRVFDVLEVRTGSPINEFRNGDPWGSPYVIDENEGEPQGGDCLRRDVVTSAGPNGLWQDGGGDDIRVYLPRFKAQPDC